MEWTGETSAGDWLRERIDTPWQGTMNDVVPRGFAAYARVFHRVTRDRPVGRAWPPESPQHQEEWEPFSRGEVEIDVERVRWADAASAFGTTMHAGAQWHRLVGRDEVSASESPIDRDGWRYFEPEQGRLDAEAVATLAALAAAHTATPDDAYVAVWEGWGGLLGFYGTTPARASISLTSSFEDGSVAEPGSGAAMREEDEAALYDRHRAMLERSISDPFNNVFRKPTWQPGMLPDTVSNGGRLELPARDHVLFRAALSELASPEWAARVPWAETPPEWTQSPSWIWPADHAFAIAGEIDWDSTIVAGSSEFVRAVCGHPALEALPIREGTSLTWDADDLNR
jgi:hypothetical protein